MTSYGFCQNCGERPATEKWIGDGGSLALSHGQARKQMCGADTEAQWRASGRTQPSPLVIARGASRMKPVSPQKKFEAIVKVSAPVSLEHVRAALQIHDLRKAVARVEFKEAA